MLKQRLATANGTAFEEAKKSTERPKEHCDEKVKYSRLEYSSSGVSSREERTQGTTQIGGLGFRQLPRASASHEKVCLIHMSLCMRQFEFLTRSDTYQAVQSQKQA